jgi:hypothetical protein
MAEVSQTYKTHTRWFPPFHFFALPVLLANVLVQFSHLWGAMTLGGVWAALVAAAIFMVALLSRLRELLSGDLQKRINELTREQLVGLRFASDAELPELVRDVLAGKLKTKREIKMRVRDWQSDWLRA